MREFIISTETNSDLPKDFLEAHNVLVIPHYYTVEEKVYGEDEELTIKEFYDEMRAGKKVGTMASNPAVILEKFTELAKQGKDILHISFSSALSCGYQNIINGANEVMEEYPDVKIVVVDTLNATLGEGLLLKKAVMLKEEGKSMEEVADTIRNLVPHMGVQFTVEDLEYLYRGGRLSKTSAIIGSMVQLKPILGVTEEGGLAAVSKVRGRKKSLSAMVANMETLMGNYKDKQVEIGIIHGDCEEDAKKLAQMIEEAYGFTDFLIAPIGPSVGAHSGPGALGIAYLVENK
ncbi:MAG: DegV family protein [Wujia sp.]